MLNRLWNSSPADALRCVTWLPPLHISKPLHIELIAKATATPSSLISGANLCLLRVAHCYHTSSSVPSLRPIPHIHVHFDPLMALTPSRTGPRPRFRGFTLPPRAPAASIAPWELCKAADSPHLSSIIHTRALSACGRALFQHADGHSHSAWCPLRTSPLGFSAFLAFAWRPPSLPGRFFGLPPLFAHAGLRLLWNKHKLPYSSCASGTAARPVHLYEAAAASPHLYTSCNSCACRRRWMEIGIE
jgi:hypothetical protein